VDHYRDADYDTSAFHAEYPMSSGEYVYNPSEDCKHSYTNEVTTAPSCVSSGVRTYTCTLCGDSYTESIAATGHSFGAWTVTTTPTCTQKGEETRTCASCGDSEYRDVNTTGHNYEISKTNASCTDPYVLNAQVVVMKADKVANYKDADSLKDLNFAVEAGSAGKDIAVEKGYKYKEYTAQSDAMTAVKTAKADACIIDITMAKAMTGEGTSFEDLGVGISLTEEEYAIACRKGSDLPAKINDLMKELKTDGTLKALADKYYVTLTD
jgi:hypothetical protein